MPVTRARTCVLFVCSQNKLRSPTAERIFSDRNGMECLSAGLDSDASNPVTADLLKWADVIFVMERRHLYKLSFKFGKLLAGKRVACLGIRDQYEFMDPELVRLLELKVEDFFLNPGDGPARHSG